MALIAVVALKGGVGKTTTAVYLSLVMAAAGQRVVLADADRQASALRWADEARGLGADVLTMGATTPEALPGVAGAGRGEDRELVEGRHLGVGGLDAVQADGSEVGKERWQ
jgi:cellulose biosynthesis protein BcsQ